jgi:phosphoribosylaminoimidazolecarboxamide formyltransferase / IMP cyclohydrolase
MNLSPARAAEPRAARIFNRGTFAHLEKILGPAAAGRLVQVSDYTGQPETQGGLVKTLDFKIYLGLLTETYNEAHQSDLRRTGSVPIDMVVVNLYPFRQTVAKAGVSLEQARGNIDIGGPCMIRASAKNFIRVASVVDPADYGSIAAELEANHGADEPGAAFSPGAEGLRAHRRLRPRHRRLPGRGGRGRCERLLPALMPCLAVEVHRV